MALALTRHPTAAHWRRQLDTAAAAAAMCRTAPGATAAAAMCHTASGATSDQHMQCTPVAPTALSSAQAQISTLLQSTVSPTISRPANILKCAVTSPCMLHVVVDIAAVCAACRVKVWTQMLQDALCKRCCNHLMTLMCHCLFNTNNMWKMVSASLSPLLLSPISRNYDDSCYLRITPSPWHTGAQVSIHAVNPAAAARLSAVSSSVGPGARPAAVHPTYVLHCIAMPVPTVQFVAYCCTSVNAATAAATVI